MGLHIDYTLGTSFGGFFFACIHNGLFFVYIYYSRSYTFWGLHIGVTYFQVITLLGHMIQGLHKRITLLGDLLQWRGHSFSRKLHFRLHTSQDDYTFWGITFQAM